MTDIDHKDLLNSLIVILKFTFITEGVGMIILSCLFYASGDSFWLAIWRGVFTSISAFCNAGFALQSDSLISYQANPLILHTVATLIILGGMSPVIALVIPKWLTGKSISTAAYIVLITSVVLLFSGMVFLLAFEWTGILSGLSVVDKIHNAWFQSVTLRTAGFNSIDIVNTFNPTFIIMICFMFIGGSPGGTAGGVKTTTIGILVMTFWANITSRDQVVIQNRYIPPKTINKALTIVVSGVLFWFLIVLMLQITQQINARDLIFEATSAIGTVGLSTGATGHLDEIGKIIIIIAMFAGRIGPMSLFMLLGDTHTSGSSRYPETKITLN